MERRIRETNSEATVSEEEDDDVETRINSSKNINCTLDLSFSSQGGSLAINNNQTHGLVKFS